MKRIKYQLGFLFTFALLAWGCEDIMDKRDLRNISADDVWITPNYVSGYVNYVMGEHMPKEEHYTYNHTEESYSLYDLQVLNDLFNTDDELTNFDKWHYIAIRRINKFLDNVEKIPFDKVPVATQERYIGQMKVLRAWLYFEMVRLYGGVPLVLHEQRLDENLSVPRSKTSECIAAIVKDLDDAIALDGFPMKWTADADAGRFGKGAAYALKGRVLLTYASPQFSNTIGAGTKSADQRWQEAYTACKIAKDSLAAAGYGLRNPNPATPAAAATNYYNLFITEVPANIEMVAVRRYVPTAYPGTWDAAVRPKCTIGSGQRPWPTLEIVNSFSNADGTPYTGLSYPNVTNGQDAAIGQSSTVAYWKNREPRFNAFIAFNGCIWPMRRVQESLANADRVNGIMQHQWIFHQAEYPYENAYDQYGGGGGFRCRKMISMTGDYITGEGYTSVAGTDYPLIRYAEVLLNFAEAAAKTGHESEAIQVIRDIRHRAGIPAGDGNYGLQSSDLTGNRLLAAILNERQIELFYEGFRFFDLRRWRLYTDDLVPGATTIREGRKMNGLYRHTIRPVVKEGVMNPANPDHAKLAALDVNDEAAYFAVFEDEIRSYDARPIAFTEHLYFMRIPYVKHIKANPVIEQTQGWEDARGAGTFNPYE